jgi:ketosteroid isomerase-like protein
VATRDQIEQWVEGYRRAWEERDGDAAAALFSADASYRDDIFAEPHRGREGVHAYWTGVTAAQSEPRVRMGNPFVDGDDRVAVEFWTTMLVGGDELTLPGCLLLRFDDEGLCTDLREYWHTLPEIREPFPGWGE